MNYLILISLIFLFDLQTQAQPAECYSQYQRPNGDHETINSDWVSEYKNYSQRNANSLEILTLSEFIDDKLSSYNNSIKQIHAHLGKVGVDSVLDSRTKVFTSKAEAASQALTEWQNSLSQPENNSWTIWKSKNTDRTKDAVSLLELVRTCKVGMDQCLNDLKSGITNTANFIMFANSVQAETNMHLINLKMLEDSLQGHPDYIHFRRIFEPQYSALVTDQTVIKSIIETEKAKTVTALFEIRHTYPKLAESIEIALSSLDAVKTEKLLTERTNSEAKTFPKMEVQKISKLPYGERVSYLISLKESQSKNIVGFKKTTAIFEIEDAMELLKLDYGSISLKHYLNQVNLVTWDSSKVVGKPLATLIILSLTRPSSIDDQNNDLLMTADLSIHAFVERLAIYAKGDSQRNEIAITRKWTDLSNAELKKFKK